MAKMIAVQLEALFPDSPGPFIVSQASPCFELSAHRVISSDKASKDGPASMLIGSGLKFAFDQGNELKLYSLSKLANEHGIRLAGFVDVIGADFKDEICFKLVRDNNEKSAVVAWDKLVDEINTKKAPRVVMAQMSEFTPPFFLVKQEEQQQQPGEAPAAEVVAEQKAPA